jgi:hypothetical protein
VTARVLLAFLLACVALGVGSGCNDASSPAGGAGYAAPAPTGSSGNAPAPGSTFDAGAGGETTGSLSAQITLPAGQNIAVVLWTISGGGTVGSVQSGLVDVSHSLVAAFIVGNLPSAMGYRITLSATADDGSVICAGSASFDVAPRATASVAVGMACNVATMGAQVTRVDGSTFNCAAVSSVTATPAETTVGSSVTVSGTANGPDPGGLSYSWTATSGSFDKPNSPTAQFTCAAAGLATLTLTAGDGPVPLGSSCATSLNTKTVAVRCDPVIAAVPALPPWAMVLLGLTMLGVGSLAAGGRAARDALRSTRAAVYR